MKVLKLDIDSLKSIPEVINFLQNQDIKRGDTVKVVTAQGKTSLLLVTVVMMVAVVVVHILKRDKKSEREVEGEALLNEVLKGKSVEEIEREVQEEFGVRIEIEQKESENEEDWYHLSMG